MPLNLIKSYNGLLEISHMSVGQRRNSLLGIFRRDIEDNEVFKFQGKQIRPIKKDDGLSSMQTLFHHLTTEEVEQKNEAGKRYKARIFEKNRSERLHWIKYHTDENRQEQVEIFSVEERNQNQRKDVIRTYIYDVVEKYVIVLEPQRSGTDYYLLTAYYLNKTYGEKMLRKKMKKRLDEVF